MYLDTISEAERLNSRAGYHFFETDTKGFFSSKIHEPIIAHRFFITSERRGFDDYGRASTIRMMRNDGSTETVGEFLEHATPAAARKALQRARSPLDPAEFGRGVLPEHGVTVRLDPYDGDLERLAGLTERKVARRHTWRAYVGELPIGPRTTQGDARAIAREAASALEL